VDHMCQNGMKFGTLVVRALLYVSAEIVNFGPGGPLRRQNTEGCKNCNAFLVHRLAEHDEIWQR